jgi:polyphosphate kinase 2 (PPK2 family)
MPEACTKSMGKLWDQRYDSIRDLEKHLARNGTHVVKFFLNVSKREQAKRFLARIEDKSKNWKFNEADLSEREQWKKYMDAYEDAVNETAAQHAPWYVIPADNKKNMRLLVAMALRKEMKKLQLAWPQFPKEDLTAMARSKRLLQAELK